MKINWLFLIFTICVATQMQAQFSLGATGGLNFSKTKFPNLVEFVEVNRELAIYQYVGLIPKYQLSEKFSVSCNIEFSEKGFQENGEFPSGEAYSFKVRTSYLDVIPKVEFHPIQAISIGLGIYVGFNQRTRVKGDEGWEKPMFDDYAASTDFGLTGSIRGNFRNFFVMVGYNYGLKNINTFIVEGEINGQELDFKEVNRNLQVGVGYFFDFEKGKG